MNKRLPNKNITQKAEHSLKQNKYKGWNYPTYASRFLEILVPKLHKNNTTWLHNYMEPHFTHEISFMFKSYDDS